MDIQLQRTLNSVPNAAGGCNVFHVLVIICFYESTAIRQRMEHRKSLTKSVFDDLVVKLFLFNKFHKSSGRIIFVPPA